MKNKMASSIIIKYLIPRLGEILFISLFITVIGLGPRLLNMDGDIGRHITLGNYILETRTIPTSDHFSFTKLGDPLTPHEWLSEVIFSIFGKIAGLDGIVLVTGIVIGFSTWLVYKTSLLLSKMNLLSIVMGIAAAAASSLHWLARPHIFTILLSAIWVWELEKVRLGIEKRWYLFPIIMLFWVNLHGAFIVGFVIWICYFVGTIEFSARPWKINRILLYTGIGSILISLLNPDGIGIWKTGIGFLSNKYLVGHTAEYLPPDFQNYSFWPFLLMILLSLVILAISKKRISLPHTLIISGWTVLALLSARNIPLYAVVVSPILTLIISEMINEHEDKIFIQFSEYQRRLMDVESGLRGGLWSIVTVALVAYLLISGVDLDIKKQGNVFLREVFPVDAVDWMNDNDVQGNGFNYFTWGGYLLYRNWPERRVFIDGQTDFYGEDFTREYETVISYAPGWQEVLKVYNVSWILIPSGSYLSNRILENEQWDTLYIDNTAVVFVKNSN